ncbi:MAG TPA: PVC-type heme-binding CxxCH protein [Planctomycetota bacterium]|nr:PVC-type heme-binding CxxCH protein [Planctomycetota bacterium]
MRIALLALLTLAAPQGAPTPDESVQKMKVFDGLAVTAWAVEPMLANPTNMDIDERGRVWVVESVNYRGFKPRPEGDRIVILEDTDKDGKADSSKVFAQDPSIVGPLGICVLGDKVYVAQSPKMLVYTIDASGDKPKGPPEVLFQGFGGANHDHGLHAIMFGPDGRFYFNAGNDGCRGAQVKDGQDKPVVDSTGSEVGGKGKVWRGGPAGGPGKRYQEGMAFRCNPDGTGFETLGHNFRNNYEVAADSFGTAWQSDNDDDGNQGVRLNYVMEGGNFGYVGYSGGNWGRDMPQYPGQLRQEAHFHQRDPGVVPNLVCTGAGSPTGILVYEGDLLPEKLRGAVIHCDAGPNVVRAYFPSHAAGGYRCDVTDVVKSSDRWFRPADVCVGVDGALYVADWTDPGVGGHATGDKDLSKISGRIYRVAPAGNKPAVPGLDLSSVKGQIDALLSPNLARRYLGYQKLVAGGDAAAKALQELWSSSAPSRHRARALWLLARLKGEAAVRDGLKDKDVDLRITAIRAARLIKMDMVALAKELIGEPDLALARELCLAMNYEPTDKALPLLVALADKVQAPDPKAMDAPMPAAEKLFQPDSALEKWRQERYLHRWYLEAVGIGATGREKELLEAWRKDGKNKDPKVAELLAWRLNREMPDGKKN